MEDGELGVPCAGCGRQYDVALFEFGRTIHCTCGRRVALEARVRNLAGRRPPRFLADAMLGSLANWLRLLGFDCAYRPDVLDEQLVRQAVEEERVLLSRDRGLPEEWRVSDVVLVVAESTFDQVCEVVRRFDLSREIRLFTRCSRCNEPLQAAPRAAVQGRVPERVWQRCEEFRSCPACARVYWHGSHTERMRRVAERVRADVRG